MEGVNAESISSSAFEIWLRKTTAKKSRQAARTKMASGKLPTVLPYVSA